MGRCTEKKCNRPIDYTVKHIKYDTIRRSMQ